MQKYQKSQPLTDPLMSNIILKIDSSLRASQCVKKTQKYCEKYLNLSLSKNSLAKHTKNNLTLMFKQRKKNFTAQFSIRLQMRLNELTR